MPYALPEKQKAAQRAWYLKKKSVSSVIPGDFRLKKQTVTWEQLNAIDLGSFSKWGECVQASKEILIARNGNKVMIAQLALRAVKIKKGGDHKTKDFLGGKYGPTLKTFAKEVGIHEKTLSDWIRVFLLVIEGLPKDQQVVDYSAARMAIEVEGRDATPEVLLERYNNIADPKKPHRTLYYFFENLRGAKTNVSQGAAEHFSAKEKKEALSLLAEIEALIKKPNTTLPMVGVGRDARNAKRKKRKSLNR